MKTAFISDLHLHDERPAGIAAFTRFVDALAGRAAGLYILGDLFEFWIGDDAPLPGYVSVMETLRRATDRGLAVFFMHGNRDFLIGERFATATGCRLLADPTVIDLDHQPVLLMHGDTLCADDTEYQQFRRRVRDPEWQTTFLSQPAERRLEIAHEYRGESVKRTGEKSALIMDVSQWAVEEAMMTHHVDCLIHGHTHRPGVHRFTLGGRAVRRIVLGDWYEQGSVLEWNGSDFEQTPLPLT